MRTRTIIAVFLALFITAGVTALWSAEGDEMDGDTATSVVAANSDGQAAAEEEGQPLGPLLQGPVQGRGEGLQRLGR
jgi:hypothetical protein